MDNQEKTLIGIIELTEAKRLAEKLLIKGIELDVKHNAQTCVKGCAVKVEVWANNEDIETIARTIQEENLRTLENEGLEIDGSLLDQVFDDESHTAICPACGTSFSTDLKECPDCGLVFIP